MKDYLIYSFIAAAVLVILAGIIFIISEKLFRVAIPRGKQLEADIEGFCKGISHSSHYIKSRSVNGEASLRLHAEYYTHESLHETSSGTIILLHGLNSLPERDFATLAPLYFSWGLDIFAINLRGQADSEGAYITYGVFDRYDVEDWCSYLLDTLKIDKSRPIILHGLSMGASTALLASSLPIIKENVTGIIADCGYTTPKAEFLHVIRMMYHLPPFPFINIANIICKHRAGWGFEDADTRVALADTTVPILFIHGDSDNFVPTDFTIENYNACAAKKELLLVVGASHAESHAVAGCVYERKCSDFLRSLGIKLTHDRDIKSEQTGVTL